MTEEMIVRVKALAEELSWDYEKIGVRVQEEPFELGPMTHCSHVWIDGEDTGEELDGVCMLSIDSISNAKYYYGDHIAVLAGNSYSYGEDEGEIILSDAVVVEILK